MKKRVMGIALVLVLAMSVVLTGCGKKGDAHSETYTGTVSTQTYATSQDAAVAFVNEEIVGAAVQATDIECSEAEELTEEETNKLALDAQYTENLAKVERITVSYTETVVEEDEKEPAPVTPGYETNEMYNAAASDAEETKKKTRVVLVLVYVNGECRYFAPVVLQGEQLTASYFDSVFNTKHYKNCTMKQTMSMNIKVNVAGQKANEKMKITSTAKFTETAAYFSQSAMGTNIEVYMQQLAGENYVKAAANMKYDGQSSGWTADEDIFEILQEMLGGEVYTLADFTENYFEMGFGNMDHTFFEKTNTGYALRKGMGKAFIMSMFESIMGDEGLPGMTSGSDITALLDLYDMDLDYEIIVNNGLVSKLKINVKMSLDMQKMANWLISQGASADIAASMSGSVSVSESGTVTFSNFGTTTVTIPEEVLAEMQ